MADMALNILGTEGGKFAVLSASAAAANQNAWIAEMQEVLKESKYSKLELLDVVYGNDQSEMSYFQALALVNKYPNMKLIMAPTTIGIKAGAIWLHTGAIQGNDGEQFVAGRLGVYTIEKDPNRASGLRTLLGPFKIYDKNNVDTEAR